MRPFLNLFLNFAPHEITKGLQSLSWEARFPWTTGPSGWPSASPGWFWLCFGWPGHKIHCPYEAKRPFCVNFELGGQISLDQGRFRLAFSQPRVILAVFWVARPQNPLSVWGQRHFFKNFGQEWHLPTQHPGFGSKLSSKGKPGTCALFKNLAISCWFLPARKAFRIASQVLYST